jgi:protein-disulfide isomerase
MAEAVECARDQDRFWEFQKILYEHSNTIERTNIHLYAKTAGVMNLRQFKTCVQERKYKNRVLNDLRDGMKLGIRGTPTFILGTFDPDTRTVSGDFLSGAVSEEKFSQVIDKHLSIPRAEARLPR